MPLTNTLETARRIESLGFTHQQAQGFAELFESSAPDAVRELKAVVAQEGERSRAELRAELAELRAELKAAAKDLELRLTLRFGAMLAAAVALLAALQKLL